MTTRSRKARSCDTVTTADGVDATNASSRSRPAKSRSLVGSSSSSTSWRRQEDGGQRGPGGLPAGQVAHLDVEPVGGQARPGRAPRRRGRRGRRRRGRGSARGRRCRPRSTSASSPIAAVAASSAADAVGHAGAPGQVGAQRLAGLGVGLLGQPAHGGGGRRPLHDAAVGRLEPGQDPQQRRLADAVRARRSPSRVPAVIGDATRPAAPPARRGGARGPWRRARAPTLPAGPTRR